MLNLCSPQNHERPQVNETLTVWGQLNLDNVINVGHSKMLIILININLITIIKNQISTIKMYIIKVDDSKMMISLEVSLR